MGRKQAGHDPPLQIATCLEIHQAFVHRSHRTLAMLRVKFTLDDNIFYVLCGFRGLCRRGIRPVVEKIASSHRPLIAMTPKNDF